MPERTPDAATRSLVTTHGPSFTIARHGWHLLHPAAPSPRPRAEHKHETRKEQNEKKEKHDDDTANVTGDSKKEINENGMTTKDGGRRDRAGNVSRDAVSTIPALRCVAFSGALTQIRVQRP